MLFGFFIVNDFQLVAILHRIMRMREAGLIDKWNRDSQPNLRQCLVKEKSKFGALKLESYSGSFSLLACGIILSLVVFIGEKVLFIIYS